MIYDMQADYKRCGHKIQQAFGITAEEFQAARKTGRKKKLGDILEWIKENRRGVAAGSAQPQAIRPNVGGNNGLSTDTAAIPGLPPRDVVILVPVPTSKLNDVLAVLGR